LRISNYRCAGCTLKKRRRRPTDDPARCHDEVHQNKFRDAEVRIPPFQPASQSLTHTEPGTRLHASAPRRPSPDGPFSTMRAGARRGCRRGSAANRFGPRARWRASYLRPDAMVRRRPYAITASLSENSRVEAAWLQPRSSSSQTSVAFLAGRGSPRDHGNSHQAAARPIQHFITQLLHAALFNNGDAI
jgi:hypothetical protein